jgi:two-component system, chemotaxis family, sensor kinase CheA
MARDPYRYFRIEASELLDQLGKGVLELDKGSASPAQIALMFRLAHTLKGAARVVKQPEVADSAHAIEDTLTPFREAGGAVSRDSVAAMLAALDEIAKRMAALAPQGQSPVVADALPSPGQGAESWRTAPLEAPASNVDEMDLLLEGLSEASAQLGGLRRGTDLRQTHRLTQLLDEQRPAAHGSSDSGARSSPRIAQLRELIERAQRIFDDGLEQLNRELAQVRESAERLRLLPARLMFVPLERAARDAGESVGKRIVVATSGGDIRLDAQVLGVVQSALVQAVRNAVAHGIETPAERKAAGKPVEGRVEIGVRQRGHRVVFVCRDDGRGVDLEAVRRAVERRGPSANAANLGTEELLANLLGGGISTSDAITQLAGRGIGLDVVRESVRRLRGEVDIRTEKGLGTTLEIIVPVTLAAVEALIVESAGRSVGIPMSSVKQTLRVVMGDVVESPHGASISFAGEVIPFAPLDRALQRAAATRNDARSWSAVIIEGASALAALGVERLCGTQDLIVRPLPDLTPCDPVVAGASFDADGRPQLVLDPEGMVEYVRRAGPALATAAAPRAPILVIDDSLTTRMLEQSILESAGYQVDLATSGEDGLERARKRRYALFLVDVEMPGMDGFSFIERVKADPALRDIPTVLVTSRSSPADRRRGKDVGAQAYIVKGEFDQTELLGSIRVLVGGR